MPRFPLSSWSKARVILTQQVWAGETMQDNRVPCYSVKVEIPSEIGRPAATYYSVQADTQSAAVTAVMDLLPDTWEAVEATFTSVRQETVEALGLFPGVPRQI